MKLMVPTHWVVVMLAESMKVGKHDFKTGEMVRVPYGVALQGMVTGTFSVMQNEHEMHAQATDMLEQYGPDSWFPAPSQTIGKLWEWVQAQRDAQGTDKDVPKNADNETIH